MNDTNAVDKSELSIFMKALLISQVKELMLRIEFERFE